MILGRIYIVILILHGNWTAKRIGVVSVRDRLCSLAIGLILSAPLFGSISTVAKPALSATINPLLLSSIVYLVSNGNDSHSLQSSSSDDSDILLLKRKNYLYIFAIAISGAVVAPTLYFMGLEQTTASHASIVSIAEIVFTALIAILFFGDRIKPIGYVGIILVLLAVFIITTAQNFQALGSLTKINYGDLLIVASTFFWGIDNNISKIVSHKINAAKNSSTEVTYW